MTTREHITLPPAECRFAVDEATGTVTGYASLFDELVPGFNEVVRRGAFARTIDEHRAASVPIVMLWSHDVSAPIGKWTVTEDQRGLRAEGQILKDVAKGREALALVQAGVVTGLSIGFRTRKSERGDKGIRIITDAQLEEISLVAFPAAPGARVSGVRSDGLPAFLEAISRWPRRPAIPLASSRLNGGGGLELRRWGRGPVTGTNAKYI